MNISLELRPNLPAPPFRALCNLDLDPRANAHTVIHKWIVCFVAALSNGVQPSKSLECAPPCGTLWLSSQLTVGEEHPLAPTAPLKAKAPPLAAHSKWHSK